MEWKDVGTAFLRCFTHTELKYLSFYFLRSHTSVFGAVSLLLNIVDVVLNFTICITFLLSASKEIFNNTVLLFMSFDMT